MFTLHEVLERSEKYSNQSVDTSLASANQNDQFLQKVDSIIVKSTAILSIHFLTN